MPSTAERAQGELPSNAWVMMSSVHGASQAGAPSCRC